MAVKKCPVCGSPVKLENLQRHVRNQHPRSDVDVEGLVTKEERREVEGKAAARRRQKVTPAGLRIVVATIAIVAVVLLLILLNPFRASINVGDVAPNFILNTSNGSQVSLTNLQGQVVFLEFMDVDCSYCINEAQNVLPSVWAAYNDRGVRFLSIDVNFVGDADNNARINDFKSRYGTNWDYMLDTGGATAAYGVNSTPTTFIINRAGVVVAKVVGAAPNGYATYAAGLDDALRG